MKIRALATAFFTVCAPLSAFATETITYKYDAKGRVVEVKRSGTVNNAVQSNYTYDKADNRTNVKVINSPNGPPAPPPTSNLPPTANADNAGSMSVCSIKTVNVTANDTDPEGNYPLTVDSATSSTISVTVVSATSVELESFPTPGTYFANYSVSDSLGATSSAQITVTVTSGVCN